MLIRKLVTRLGFDVDETGIKYANNLIKEYKRQVIGASRALNTGTKKASTQVKILNRGIVKSTIAWNATKRASSGVTHNLKTQVRTARILSKEYKKIRSAVMNVAQGTRNAALVGSAAISAPIAATFGAGAKKYAKRKTDEVSFDVMIGDTSKSKTMLSDMQKLALDTSLDMDNLVTITKRFLAAGVQSEDMVGVLKRIGDTALGNSETMDRIAIQYSQIQLRGKAMWEDLRRMGDAGVPVVDELAKVLGVTKEELTDMSRKGQITSEHVEQAFINMTSEGGRFHGMLDKMSTELGGSFQRLGSLIHEVLVMVGRDIAPMLQVFVDGLIKMFEGFRNLAAPIRWFIYALATTVAIIPVVILFVSQLTIAMLGLATMTMMVGDNIQRMGDAMKTAKALMAAMRAGIAKNIIMHKLENAVLITKRLLQGPYGWAILGAAGIAVAGTAGYLGYKHLKNSADDRIKSSRDAAKNLNLNKDTIAPLKQAVEGLNSKTDYRTPIHDTSMQNFDRGEKSRDIRTVNGKVDVVLSAPIQVPAGTTQEQEEHLERVAQRVLSKDLNRMVGGIINQTGEEV